MDFSQTELFFAVFEESCEVVVVVAFLLELGAFSISASSYLASTPVGSGGVSLQR